MIFTLFEKQTKRKKKTELFHLLVHSSNACLARARVADARSLELSPDLCMCGREPTEISPPAASQGVSYHEGESEVELEFEQRHSNTECKCPIR